MQATSEAQYAAALGDHAPDLEKVRDGLWSLGMPMPIVQPHFTLSYLVRDDDGGIHLVDPGWDSDENWQRLVDALEEVGSATEQVRSVVVTHLHPDHLGMAERVREKTGARVALHRVEQEGIHELRQGESPESASARFTQWGAPLDVHGELVEAANRRNAWKPFTADLLLDDGDVLDIPGWELEVLHTPGHTTGHLALVDASKKLLLTGDLLLPSQFPGIGLGGTSITNPIDDYLASIHRIAEFGNYEVLPGHGYRFTGLSERCAVTAAHHDQRTGEVRTALTARPESTVWEIAAGLTWTAGWENLRGLELLSALAQTDTHLDRVVAG